MSTDEVQALSKKIDKIISYLHNDEETGKKGLVAEVAEIKDKFNGFLVSYKVEKSFNKGMIAVIASIGGGVAFLIELAIKLLVK